MVFAIAFVTSTYFPCDKSPKLKKMILFFKLDILMITYSKAIEATYESADLIPAVKLGSFAIASVVL